MSLKTKASLGVAMAAAAVLAATTWRLWQGSAQPWAWAFLLPGGAAITLLGCALVCEYTDPVRRYLARHRPLAGPREGAELPG